MEDYSDLLATLDEILGEEHDVEIAASAAAIRSLMTKNARLEDDLNGACDMMDEMEAKVWRLREALQEMKEKSQHEQ